MVDQRRDLRVRIDRDKATPELLAVSDVDQVGVVLRILAEGQQLFQEHRDLHAVWRSERVELESVLADRQLLLVCSSRDGTIDVGETPAAFGIPLPDLWRRVRG